MRDKSENTRANSGRERLVPSHHHHTAHISAPCRPALPPAHHYEGNGISSSLETYLLMHVRPANCEADSVVLHDSDPMFKVRFLFALFCTIDAVVSCGADQLIHPTQRAENGCKCILLKTQSPHATELVTPGMVQVDYNNVLL